MTPPLRVGIAGLGTVGAGTLEYLRKNRELITARCGRELIVTAVSARNPDKKRDADLNDIAFHRDPLELVKDKNVDVVVEVIGGKDGIAKQLVEAAIDAGKSVVTANKALLAHHGAELATRAEAKGVTLAFETAVAGGIPIIKALREGLIANRISRVAGILNATCNVILTEMWDKKLDLPLVMEEAARMSILETDPSLDIDGYDAAHKISILTALAFGSAPAINDVYREGIRAISLRDMFYAYSLGYVIKLLAISSVTKDGIMQRVHPCLVPRKSRLAHVHGANNAVMMEGDASGKILFEGLGGGTGPTASAIIGDLADIARGVHYSPFTLRGDALTPVKPADMNKQRFGYYLRLTVSDQVGVLASVTKLLEEQGISVRTFLQEDHRENEPAHLVLTTHETEEGLLLHALARIATLPAVKEKPQMIRIEEL